MTALDLDEGQANNYDLLRCKQVLNRASYLKELFPPVNSL